MAKYISRCYRQKQVQISYLIFKPSYVFLKRQGQVQVYALTLTTMVGHGANRKYLFCFINFLPLFAASFSLKVFLQFCLLLIQFLFGQKTRQLLRRHEQSEMLSVFLSHPRMGGTKPSTHVGRLGEETDDISDLGTKTIRGFCAHRER